MAARLPSKPPKNLTPDPSLGESEGRMLKASASPSPVLQELGHLIRRTPALKKRVAALRTQVLWLQHIVDTMLISEAERSEADHLSWSDLRTKVHEVVIGAYRLVQEVRKTSGKADGGSWESAVLIPFEDIVLNFGQLSLGNYVTDLQETVRQLDNILFDLLGSDEKGNE